ncbi:MAG: hypothetical protein K6F69_06705 [Treponema sp.]|nr:hypothetical protein [Treponema sp.]
MEPVYPEFDAFFIGRALVNGAIDISFDLYNMASSYINAQTGGLKQWVRVGDSHSLKMNVETKSLRWGASPKYQKRIKNLKLRKINQQIRQKKIHVNNWRTNDAGHVHFLFKDNNSGTWHFIKRGK